MTEPRTFEPDWLSPPGDTILDVLVERGWTQVDLAERTGFTRRHVNDLVKGRMAITPDAALRLEATIGSTAHFWLRRDALYRERLARRATVVGVAPGIVVGRLQHDGLVPFRSTLNELKVRYAWQSGDG